MTALKRIAEWYLNVPDVSAGEDTNWTFSSDWPAWLPLWACIPAVLLVGGLIAVIYRRDARTAGPRMRGSLVALRAAQVALVGVFLSNVTASVDTVELPVVVVLIDRSASMTLEDHYRDDDADRSVQQLLSTADMEKASRMNLAKAVLTKNRGAFLKRLQTHHRLHIYEFAEEARRFGQGKFFSPEDVDHLVPRLKRDLHADGKLTNHKQALQRVLEDFSGSPPAAIVLLSDGITTSGENDRLSNAVPLVEKHSVPVFVLALGSATPARDLQLSGLLAPEVAFVNDPITFSADLQAFGVERRHVTLRLRRKGQADVLASRKVDLAQSRGQSGVTRRVELTYLPLKQGENVEFVLEAVPLKEETNTRNNAQTARISIRADTLNVLLADSTPRYEFRYLKHLLEREKTVKLHTILQEADRQYAAEDATAKTLKGRFPLERDALFAYDAIILGDVDLSVIPDDVLMNLRDFVRAGGSLIMIAGLQFNPITYSMPPVKSLLPFELSGVKPPADDEIIEQGFRPVLNAAGRSHSMFRLTTAGKSNTAVWKQLPPLYWILKLGELKPGAEVFVEHPTRQTEPLGREERRRPLPVILMHRVGAGKVLYHTTDELWRWRRLVGDLYYGRYWIQALRALSRSKIIGQSRDAELESDRREYVTGQNVQLHLRFFDEKQVPDSQEAIVVIERNGVEVDRLKLKRVPHLPHVFAGEFSGGTGGALSEGNYRAWVVSPFFEQGTPSTTFSVNPPQKELQDRTLRTNELQTIAAQLPTNDNESTGTKTMYFTPANAEDIPHDIPRGKPTRHNNPRSIPLWNRWELMLLFALLLTGEWLLRKRLRLI